MTINTLTVGTLGLTGTTLTTSAMGASDTAFDFVNDGNTFVILENASGSTVVFTIDAQSIDGLSITDPTVSVGAGATKIVGPFDPKYFNSGGKVTITPVAAGTSVKALALRMR